jgi:hypothetical protein
MGSIVTGSRSNSFVGNVYQKSYAREKMVSNSFENMFETKGKMEKDTSKTTFMPYTSMSISKGCYLEFVKNIREIPYNTTNLSGYMKYEKMLEDYNLLAQNQESETNTNIIVKPDGSRVLVVTMNVGGMETTMSLEISKPTEHPNEQAVSDSETNQLDQGITDEAEIMMNE